VATIRSAGILVFRKMGPAVEVLIGHMGGPLWARRDDGGWSIPKGQYLSDEEPLAAARREFLEELGLPAPDGDLLDLGTVGQPSGKLVTIWAVEGDLDPSAVVPGTFQMEWPRGSGTIADFPEIDRVGWFSIDDARTKLVRGQIAFLDHLEEQLRTD
jgi:predicted NUDIX family NTP pyrophosphohydrolase